MILVIEVIGMSTHFLTSEVAIGSRSHDVVGEDFFKNFVEVILRYWIERG